MSNPTACQAFMAKFFGVDPTQIASMSNRDILLAEITSLQQSLAAKVALLNSGGEVNHYNLTPELLQIHRQRFPFFSGSLEYLSEEDTFEIRTESVPMNCLWGPEQGTFPAAGVLYTTLPIYAYSLKVLPTAREVALSNHYPNPLPPSNGAWSRSGERQNHAHESTRMPESSDLCTGSTNRLARAIRQGMVTDVTSFNIWMYDTLTWIQSINLHDSYGNHCSRILSAPSEEVEGVGALTAPRVAEYTRMLGEVLREAQSSDQTVSVRTLQEVLENIQSDADAWGKIVERSGEDYALMLRTLVLVMQEAVAVIQALLRTYGEVSEIIDADTPGFPRVLITLITLRQLTYGAAAAAALLRGNKLAQLQQCIYEDFVYAHSRFSVNQHFRDGDMDHYPKPQKLLDQPRALHAWAEKTNSTDTRLIAKLSELF